MIDIGKQKLLFLEVLWVELVLAELKHSVILLDMLLSSLVRLITIPAVALLL